MSCHKQFIHNKRLFIYGGTDGEDTFKDVLEIIEEEGQFYIQSLNIKSLIMPRINPVVWVYKSDVYVFGGYVATKGIVFDMHRLSMKDMNDLEFKEVSFVAQKHLN